MPPSKLDSLYRRMLVTKFFEKGWGKPENLQRLFQFRKIISNREKCYKLIPRDYPVNITKEDEHSDFVVLQGNFESPLEFHLPGIIPPAVQQAHFQVLLPKKWKHEIHKPMCIHLAGTGDHFFWRRRNFIAKPLLRDANIGAIILENPFYGVRKPHNQVRSNLHNVSDIFVMGGCLILECIVLLHWCERNGFGPLGITGLSMGGHMASLAATNWPKPIALVPCLSWSTASAVFTTHARKLPFPLIDQAIKTSKESSSGKSGVMSQSINWDMLETQYYSDGKYKESLSKMVTVIDDAFTAGQKFIKNFNQSLKELEKDINESKSSTPLIHDNIIDSAEKKEKGTFENKPKIIKSQNTLHDNWIQKQTSEKNGSQLSLENNNSRTDSSKGYLGRESTLTKLMKYILPHPSLSQNYKIDITRTNWWEREALQFMRGMMDECTHLKNFSLPFDTSLIIAVCAKDDAYVPREGCSSLEEIWPGVEVRYLDAGHVSAYVLHQKLFRSCIIEAFERAKRKIESSKDSIGDNLEPEASKEITYVNQGFVSDTSSANATVNKLQ